MRERENFHHLIFEWNKKGMLGRMCFALVNFVLEGNFQVLAPLGLYSDGRFDGVV